MVDYMQKVGAAIHSVRKEQRLSITEVHFRTRIAHQAIRKIERGEVYPRLDTLLNICQALEVKPSRLFVMVDGL